MMTTADDPPPSTMATFIPNLPPHQTTSIAANGADNTRKIQRFKTPIKIEFVVAASQTTFNLAKAHQEIITLLQGKDPILIIVPSKAGKATFKDIHRFPANENDCNAHFDCAPKMTPLKPKKVK
jgi:hypothetical protein